MQDTILKYALQNAVKFKGKANPGAIIGKLFKEDPNLKSKAAELGKKIAEVVKEVNKMKPEEQLAKLKQLAPELLEKKEKEERGLPELKDAKEGEVVTRIPPEPSKYNHIGHALSFLINYLYAKKYKGRAILRFEDTNPTKAKQEYVDAMKEDVLEYLDIQPDKTVYVSDDMEKFYELAEKLIQQAKAYVCFCDRESMQKNRHNAKPCECRDKDPNLDMSAWADMKKGKYDDGSAVLRLKIDMEADNQVLRDPVIFRLISDEHYRQKKKYRVWSMYDFENAVEEELCGITHVLRSNEFGRMRAELQDYIKDLFQFRKQVIREYGRFNIVGAVTQGRQIREMIEKGEAFGWDDPKLVTLRALKRRGIVKETYYELVKKVGLSPAPTNIDFTLLASINRKILDASAHRYFFVKNPKKIIIEGAPEQEVKLDLHPDNKKGGRKFKTAEEFYVTPEDLKSFKEKKLYRLMDCVNFTKQAKKFVFDSLDYKTFKENGDKIIHWLPVSEDLVDIEVLMPDHKVIKGLGEANLRKIKIGDVIQLTRFGFCRLDSVEKNLYKFWFTHD